MKRPILSRKLELQTRQQTPDGAGGFTVSWVTQGTLWAHVSPRTGRAAGGSAASHMRQGLRITCRAAPEGSPARPRPGQRFREGGRHYAILAVALAEAGPNYLVIQAEEEAVR